MDVGSELISLCTPVKNRLDDLRQTMPLRIRAANECPPVEICILDCGSTDGLQDYMDELMEVARLVPGSNIVYKRIERECWHVAKAYNMAVLMGTGDYILHLNADALIYSGFIPCIRKYITDGYVWGRANHFRGNKWIKKSEFIDAGGFDERFEFYGPEDRDFEYRLQLRGGKFGLIPELMIGEIYTPDAKKVANYRVAASKHTMSKMMRTYYDENCENGVLVANSGVEWGTWS